MEPDNSIPKNPVNQPITYERVPDEQFFDGYANNIFMESSAWDLKLIFGKLDQQKGSNVVVQHSAITLPWNYVKALTYLLQVNLYVNEMLNGKVHLPKGVIPVPVPPTEDQQRDFPRAKETFEFAQQIFRKLVAENPESLGLETPTP